MPLKKQLIIVQLRLSDYIDDVGTQLHGASDVAALIKQRGEAIYDDSWRDTANTTYICEYHIRSLGITENFKKYGKKRRIGSGADACSMPAGLGVTHAKNIPVDRRSEVTFEEAQAILKVHRAHVYAGTRKCCRFYRASPCCVFSAVCRDHRKLVGKALVEYLSQNNEKYESSKNGKCLPRHASVTDAAEHSFYQFVKSMGNEMQCPRTNFSDSAPRTKRYKVAQADAAFKFITMVRAPFDFQDLQQAVCERNMKTNKPRTVSDPTVDVFLGIYNAATDKNLKKWALSILSHNLPHSQLREYLPDLSSTKYFSAKRAYTLVPSTSQPITRMKYNKTAVFDFVSFITRFELRVKM